MEFECPVCFEDLEPPIYKCHAGHSLCKSCITKLKLCPQCRQDLPPCKVRNVEFENRLLYLRTVPCKFAAQGCTTRLNASTMDKHAKKCSFRLSAREFARNGCKALVKFTRMEKHMQCCPHRPKAAVVTQTQVQLTQTQAQVAASSSNNASSSSSQLVRCFQGCSAFMKASRMANHMKRCPHKRAESINVNVNVACGSSSRPKPASAVKMATKSAIGLDIAPRISPSSFVPCKFALNGCKATLKLSNMALDTQRCNFATQNYCALLGNPCQTALRATQWPEHALSAHGIHAVVAKLNQDFLIEQRIRLQGAAAQQLRDIEWRSVRIIMQGKSTHNSFVLHTKAAGQNRVAWTVKHADNNNGGSFKVAVTFFIVGSDSSLSWTGPVAAYGSEADADDCLSIPFQRLLGVGRWKLNICISKGAAKADRVNSSTPSVVIINETAITTSRRQPSSSPSPSSQPRSKTLAGNWRIVRAGASADQPRLQHCHKCLRWIPNFHFVGDSCRSCQFLIDSDSD